MNIPEYKLDPEEPTLRDRFAMAALTLMNHKELHIDLSLRNYDEKVKRLVSISYKIADAMLVERDKNGSS